MDLEQKYKEETGFDVGKIHEIGTTYYSDDYVKWLEKAIDYIPCCEELKELDSDNFEDWLIVNGYAVFDNYYLKGDIAFSESELIEIYNKEVMSL